MLRCLVLTPERSSLYAEYASCEGPPEHQGAPFLSKMFSLKFSFLSWPAVVKTWIINYFNAVRSHPLYVKSQSTHVTWTPYSPLHETKTPQKTSVPSRRRDVSRVLSASAIRDGVKHGQIRFIHSFIPRPPPPLPCPSTGDTVLLRIGTASHKLTRFLHKPGLCFVSRNRMQLSPFLSD